MSLYRRKGNLQDGRISDLDDKVVKSITDNTPGSIKINNIIKISQTDYDNITEPDSKTLYIIVS